jgi:voltage-gated potassium channel
MATPAVAMISSMATEPDAGAAPPATDPATNEARLAAWERRTRPLIIAAALIPLVGVSTGTTDFGFIGNVIEVACWVVFLVDLIVHMRLHPRYLGTGFGKFDLTVVVLTSPWYLIPGVQAGQAVTVLRLARLARVAMIGLKSSIVKRTVERLGKPAMYAGIMLMVSSAIVMRAEDHKHGFKTYGDSLWWGVVTITTVGYGDIVPETRIGRLTATALMITGVALLGTVAASLASLFRLEDKAVEDDEDQDGGAVSGEVVAAPIGSEIASDIAAELRALRAEVAALREALAHRDP